MACGLVGVDQTFVTHTVDHGYGCFECVFCSGLVTGVNGVYYFFDVGTEHGTLVRIAATATNCLTSAFSCLW